MVDGVVLSGDESDVQTLDAAAEEACREHALLILLDVRQHVAQRPLYARFASQAEQTCKRKRVRNKVAQPTRSGAPHAMEAEQAHLPPAEGVQVAQHPRAVTCDRPQSHDCGHKS